MVCLLCLRLCKDKLPLDLLIPDGLSNAMNGKFYRQKANDLSCFGPMQVDDPVASVQKLFTSPQAKRRKLVRPS